VRAPRGARDWPRAALGADQTPHITVFDLLVDVGAAKREALRLQTTHAMGLPIASFESPDLRALIDRAFAPISVAEPRPRREPVPAPKPVGDRPAHVV
jgi:hypothetical protein